MKIELFGTRRISEILFPNEVKSNDDTKKSTFQHS